MKNVSCTLLRSKYLLCNYYYSIPAGLYSCLVSRIRHSNQKTMDTVQSKGVGGGGGGGGSGNHSSGHCN
jgi:hypothetical protein